MNLMRHRKWQLASYSLLLLYFMIIMNRVSVSRGIDLVYWLNKVGVLICLHVNRRTICVSLADVRCTVFYSAPRRSKQVVALCSDDVCQCAESKPFTKNKKQKINTLKKIIMFIMFFFLKDPVTK